MNEYRASVKTYSEPVFSKQFVSWSEFTEQTPLDTISIQFCRIPLSEMVTFSPSYLHLFR